VRARTDPIAAGCTQQLHVGEVTQVQPTYLQKRVSQPCNTVYELTDLLQQQLCMYPWSAGTHMCLQLRSSSCYSNTMQNTAQHCSANHASLTIKTNSTQCHGHSNYSSYNVATQQRCCTHGYGLMGNMMMMMLYTRNQLPGRLQQ
jgi:hypothetical protein